MDRSHFFAVDIGNTRVKCGRFPMPASISGLPTPDVVVSLDPQRDEWAKLEELLAEAPPTTAFPMWWIASVNRPSTTEFLEIVRKHRPTDQAFLLTSAEIPLTVRLPHPDRVGIDRLAAALAANGLRRAGVPMIVVDVGTAITVDVLSEEGEFLGGAIACGPGTAARALYEFTDLLPQIDVGWHVPPAPVGKNTVEAMAAGVFWTMVGTVRELVVQQGRALQAEPDVVITGGGGRLLAEVLGGDATYVEHLTLSGIALAVYHYLSQTGRLP